MSAWTTADLSDARPEAATAVPVLRHFGGVRRFCGPIRTVRIFEDNVLVLETLRQAPAGSVVVADGGGSVRVALMGDRLAGIAIDQGLAGVVINGCIRDSAEIGSMAIGVMAVGTVPRRSAKRGEGERDVEVTFGGVTFLPGAWLYADEDGILVVSERIHG